MGAQNQIVQATGCKKTQRSTISHKLVFPQHTHTHTYTELHTAVRCVVRHRAYHTAYHSIGQHNNDANFVTVTSHPLHGSPFPHRTTTPVSLRYTLMERHFHKKKHKKKAYHRRSD
uniref:Uncharacterized protein n=1 Tax=Trypanosoma congolense (strain IL3000) TaxID=1068625 RepID=G0UKY4_TRYCI|nr:hypothetical protein, unlikely [Trypanosoma congolense IL3000]